jgi:hypothetical protein
MHRMEEAGATTDWDTALLLLTKAVREAPHLHHAALLASCLRLVHGRLVSRLAAGALAAVCPQDLALPCGGEPGDCHQASGFQLPVSAAQETAALMREFASSPGLAGEWLAPATTGPHATLGHSAPLLSALLLCAPPGEATQTIGPGDLVRREEEAGLPEGLDTETLRVVACLASGRSQSVEILAEAVSRKKAAGPRVVKPEGRPGALMAVAASASPRAASPAVHQLFTSSIRSKGGGPPVQSRGEKPLQLQLQIEREAARDGLGEYEVLRLQNLRDRLRQFQSMNFESVDEGQVRTKAAPGSREPGAAPRPRRTRATEVQAEDPEPGPTSKVRSRSKASYSEAALEKVVKKLRKKIKKAEELETNLKQAKEGLDSGRFESVRTAAAENGVPRSTLQRYLRMNGIIKKHGGRRESKCVLTMDEEREIVEFVDRRQKLGCGLSFSQLETIIQEVLLALTAKDPARITGFEDTYHLPNKVWTWRLMRRHKIVLRVGMAISQSRAQVSPEDIDRWFGAVRTNILTKPGIAEAFQDPARIYNQDETAVRLGEEKAKVLAPQGTKVYIVSLEMQVHLKTCRRWRYWRDPPATTPPIPLLRRHLGSSLARASSSRVSTISVVVIYVALNYRQEECGSETARPPREGKVIRNLDLLVRREGLHRHDSVP